MLKITFRIIKHICGECGRFHPYVDDPKWGACKLRGEPRMPKIITVREDGECAREKQSRSDSHKGRYFIPKIITR